MKTRQAAAIKKHINYVIGMRREIEDNILAFLAFLGTGQFITYFVNCKETIATPCGCPYFFQTIYHCFRIYYLKR